LKNTQSVTQTALWSWHI